MGLRNEGNGLVLGAGVNILRSLRRNGHNNKQCWRLSDEYSPNVWQPSQKPSRHMNMRQREA